MLTITGLFKTYAGGVRALDGIDIDIPRGLFGLLGPNGAGKSTLMRTIATLQDADTGTIRFDGIDAFKDRMALQRRLGYLPQEFGTYPRISAQAMLRHFAALKGIHGAANRAIVDELLVRTNLWEARTRSVDTFSGGMRQRFGIAQALLGNPDLLIVDEPTAGLDPVERRRFQNLLSEVGEDVVVILSTHIVEDVAALCPRVAIMADGRILKSGDPRELTAELQGNLWSGIVDKGGAGHPGAGHQVITTRRFAGRTEVRVLAAQAPAGFTAAAPTLEDVYFKTLIDHGIPIQAE
ncbi:ABC transporter ATP-binding protein [Niveispirillum sp.]|uniref:ABC transporter ATP-binding protein n=1 Tax=Niveispirillum sp. TaxID=1917217 RepID=UPI001B55EFA7|nr:ABC transporter ATP-binding protein [Niveispirillum sp.]MBP7340592.1 ABC transporter ATP-binding protein [Niveispirillum sp.]